MSAPSLIERELSRRGLLVGAAGGAAGLAGVLRLLEQIAGVSEALASAPGPRQQASADVIRRTIAAFADTIVPGPAGGADPHPGAVEAGVVDEMYDPFYGADGIYPALHADLQLATPVVLGRPESFDLALPYRDRERVILDRVGRDSDGANPLWLMHIAVATLVWQIYYGVAASTAGVDYLRFRPHSDGYSPGHSYGLRFRGMTKGGNPP